MDIQALLFDFDGTLVNSEALHYQSWLKVLAPFNIHYTEERFCDEFSGVPTLNTAAILKERHTLKGLPSDLASEKNRLFVATAALLKPTLMPYAEEILQKASGHFKLALVTGSTRAEALPVLEYYNLKHFFEVIVCKDDVGKPKPDPEPYLQALSRLRTLATQAVAIEDTQTGLSSANSAQLTTIVVPNEHSKQQAFGQATFIEHDLKKTWSRIKQLALL